MDEVPMMLGSVSFQSNEVSGAQNSVFLFCADRQEGQGARGARRQGRARLVRSVGRGWVGRGPGRRNVGGQGRRERGGGGGGAVATFCRICQTTAAAVKLETGVWLWAGSYIVQQALEPNGLIVRDLPESEIVPCCGQ